MSATRLPDLPGVGFKPRHLPALLADPRPVAWVEVHAENHLSAGGPTMAALRAVAERMPVSVHGVGLSIGATRPLDRDHLARVAALVRHLDPASFSEHLAWSSHDTGYTADLLPLPYTDATLAAVCAHVDQVQEAIGRTLLLENPASYLTFPESDWEEPAFLAEVARRSGCGMLLDVANVHVSARNVGVSPDAYLAAYPLDLVGEIHLAGPTPDAADPAVLIDSHAAQVPQAVWDLLHRVIARTGPRPCLIEWDDDVPDFAVLAAEAARAAAVLAGHRAVA